ncbi:hypothetical protein Q1695_000513 [Nippostrongylus brasiliensis]|nr:hypothetical protein Q1695_000513 [Nippostrongylus brasiliensis]
MLLSNAVTQAKKKYWESDISSISFVAPYMSPRSAEKRVRVLEEALCRNGELKRETAIPSRRELQDEFEEEERDIHCMAERLR